MTLKPAGVTAFVIVVIGARSPKQAIKASPLNPKSALRQKSKPLDATCVWNETNGLGGLGFGNSASTGSRPWPPSPQYGSSRRMPEAKSGQPYHSPFSIL